MSRAVWKNIPDEELVKMLSASGYLIHKDTDTKVYQNVISGLYRVTQGSDIDFALADALTKAEMIQFFDD